MDQPSRHRLTPGKLLWRAGRVLAIAYLGIIILGCMFQRRLIYFPNPDPVRLPTGALHAGLAEVALVASDGVPLKAWHWPGARPPTLVMFHGNAGHRGHRLAWMEALRATGVGLFILDYRGYGGSGGSPSEEGLYRDGLAAVEWLESKGAGPLVYFGESLGTAVAVEVALRRPPSALILQSSFSSVTDVARRHYPFLPVRLLLRERFDSLERIESVRCPVLFIHGEKDSLVPFDLGRKLFDRCSAPKEWFTLPGADHNDPLWEAPGYRERIEGFLGLGQSGERP